MANNWLTEEEVRKWYIEENLTIEEAARAAYCCRETFAKYMKLYGIKGRSRSDRLGLTKKDLETMYNDKLMTMKEIADAYGTTVKTINQTFKRLAIKTRTPAESYGLRMKSGKIKKGQKR